MCTLIIQALEKADEAKNSADKSVAIISTTMNAIDDIVGQIGEYHNELYSTKISEGTHTHIRC